MNLIHLPRVIVVVFFMALVGVAPLSAQDFNYSLLIDSDNRAATGCSINSAQLGVTIDGIERRLTASVDRSSLTVTALSVEACSGGNFSTAELIGGGYLVGLNNGINSADVIELFLPSSTLGGQNSQLRLYYFSQSLLGGGEDLLATSNGLDDGDILFFGIPFAIPALSGVALIFLVISFLALAAFFLRRRRINPKLLLSLVVLSFAAIAAHFISDGEISEWSGINPIAIDPQGDASNAENSVDIVAGFVALENNHLYFRMDLADLENSAPSATDAAAVTDEDTAVVINLNGADSDGDALNFTIELAPSNGSLSAVTSTGLMTATVIYTPNADYNGADSFTFVADDGAGGVSAAATISITVNPVDDPPLAVAAAASVDENAASTLVISGTDVDGDPLGFAIATPPTNGSLSIITPLSTSSAEIIYTHDGSETLSDSFTFTANDGTSSSSAVAFTITINPINDPPELDLNGPVVGTGFTSNFTGLAPVIIVDAMALSVTDVDSTTLMSASITINNPQDGVLETLFATASGSIVVVPGTNSLTLTGPATLADFQASLRTLSYNNSAAVPTLLPDRVVDFVINDGVDDSVLVQSTVVMQQAPTAMGDNYNVLTASVLTVADGIGDILSNDQLGAPTASLSFFGGGSLGGAVGDNLAGATLAIGAGSLTVNADGSFNFTSDTGFIGTFSFQYRIANSVANADATVTIDVRQLPTANPDPSYSTLIGTLLSIADGPTDLLNNDILGAPAALLTSFGGGSLSGDASSNVAGSSVVLGSGSLVVNSDGSFNFTPDTGFTGAFTFLYRLSNSEGSSDALATITVNQGPAAVNDTNYTVLTGNLLAVIDGVSDLLVNDGLGFPQAILASFGGGSLGGAVSDNAAGATLAMGAGSLTVNVDGSFNFTSDTGFTGPFTFQYRIVNSVGSADATVTIDVRQLPIANPDPSYSTLIGTLLSVADGPTDLLGNDALGAPVALLTSFGGGSLSGDASSNASGSSVALGMGSLVVNSDGSFDFTPDTGFTGAFTFFYRLSNSEGFSDALTTITVNQAPAAVNDTNYTVLTGNLLTVIDGATDLLVNDGLGFPQATLASFGGGSLGGIVSDNATGATLAMGAGSLTVNADGSFNFTSDTGFTGPFTFQYRIVNSVGSADATVTIDVRQLPIANPDPLYSTLIGTLLSVADGPTDLLGNDALGAPVALLTSFGGGNLGGDASSNATGSSVALGSGSLVVNSDGSFNFTPDIGFTGAFTFLYRLSNSEGFSDALVTITVNQGPTAVNDVSFTVLTGNLLAIADGASDLLFNDSLGVPVAALASFGGGSLGGLVSDNAAGATVVIGAGNLTVNVDGSFNFTSDTGFTGPFTFQYRISNSVGSADASVTIDVRELPLAVNDSSYFVLPGGTLTVNDGPGDLSSNDNLGVPTAQLTSFGGGSLGGGVTDNAVGMTVAVGSGSLTVNADGSFVFVADPGLMGNFSFQYRLSNSEGSSDATVTISGQQAPVAMDDSSFSASSGGLLNVAAAGVLANDALGIPAALISSFGGGSLGGLVSDNLAGASVPLGTGNLQVNADGSFMFTSNTGFSGNFTYQYRLSNVAGNSDATVTISVSAPPVAVDDSVAAGSSPGGNYHSALNTTLLVADGALDLLNNDTLGFPVAQLTSFGGGDLMGSVTDNAAGSMVAMGASGSLLVSSDGSFSFTPETNFTGLFSFNYRITNSGGVDDGQVTLAVGVRPSASDDAQSATGNVQIDTAITNFSVLDNDTGDQLLITATDVSGTMGDLVMSPNGEFTFNPAAAVIATDTFSYTLGNGFGTVSANVTLTVSDMIWFVDALATCPCDGRLTDPFDELVGGGSFDALASDAVGDSIFIYQGSYTGNLTLLNNQRLMGDGSSTTLSSVSGITFAANSANLPVFSGTDPQITSASNGIVLGLGNTIRGLTVGNTTSGFGILGNGVGTLSISETSVMGNGGAISISNGIANSVSFDQLSSNAAASDGVFLDALSGSITVVSSMSSISASTARAVSISNGSVSLSYPGSINNTATGILIASNSAGSLSFTGASKIINSGVNPAVTLTNNTGTSITFSGGGLGITTTSGQGINATGGATLAIGGPSNSIATSSGIALNVVNTTIAASGINFQSISAGTLAGTSGVGINLDTTGASGGLMVTGNGSVASGGTIRNKTGANASINSGIGIRLNQTQAVNLNWMQLNDFDNFAVVGSGVIGFILSDSVVDGVNGNSFGDDEGSISLSGLSGSASFTNDLIEGGWEDNINVANSSGTLNRMTVSNSTIGLTSASGNDGILVESSGSATLNLTVSGVVFLGSRGDHVQANALGTSSMDVIIQDNSFQNSLGGLSLGAGVTVSGGSLGSNLSTSYSVSSTMPGVQTFTGARSNAITVNYVNGSGSAVGNVNDNRIGVSGVAGSGSFGASGIALGTQVNLTHTLEADSNIIDGISGFAGIDLSSSGSAAMFADITNNDINEFSSFAFAAIDTIVGGNLGDTSSLCVHIIGNTLDASGSFGLDYFIDQISVASSYNFPGYVGPVSGGGAVNAHHDAQNTIVGFGGDGSFATNITGVGVECVP